MKWSTVFVTSLATLATGSALLAFQSEDGAATDAGDPTAQALAEISTLDVGQHDWPQWGGWSHKNNTPQASDLPVEWNVDSGENVLW